MKMKCYYHIIWFYLLVFCTQFDTGSGMYPEKISTVLGGNLTIELASSESQYDTIFSCRIELPNGRSPLEVFANASYREFKVETNAPDTVNIKCNNRCQFSITSISSVSEGVWRLYVLDDYSQLIRIRITLLPIPKANETLEGAIGSFVIFDCEKSSSSEAKFCSIFSNSGKLYSSDCSFRLDPVKVDHIGDWTCVMHVNGSMNQFNHTIHLVESPGIDSVHGSLEDDGYSVILKCTIFLPSIETKWCRAISPTGRIFLLHDGLSSGRYSSRYSVVKKDTNRIIYGPYDIVPEARSTCRLRIDVPLDVYLDYGRWRIDFGNTAEDFTGCFIDLPNNTHTMPAPKISSEPIDSLIIRSGSSLRIHCEVPWPADYCYIRRPNGQFVKPKGASINRLLQVGVCLITIENVKKDQAGRWTCGLSSDDDTEDKLFYTDVTVVTNPIHSVEPSVIARMGEEAFLLCRSVEKKAMRYCRFTSPSRTGYSLKPNITADTRLSYWGTGLKYGECGLRIRDIKDEDFGNWKCAATFDSFSEEDVATIYIYKAY